MVSTPNDLHTRSTLPTGQPGGSAYNVFVSELEELGPVLEDSYYECDDLQYHPPKSRDHSEAS